MHLLPPTPPSYPTDHSEHYLDNRHALYYGALILGTTDHFDRCICICEASATKQSYAGALIALLRRQGKTLFLSKVFFICKLTFSSLLNSHFFYESLFVNSEIRSDLSKMEEI